MSFIWVIFSAFTFAQTTETFQSYSTGVWVDGTVRGPWISEYNGYGQVGIQRESSSSTNKVLFQRPMASTSSGETHAGLVLTTKDYKLSSWSLRSKVVKQLRTPVPNPWETAWAVWNYQHDHHFYYFAFKTNGWELGKVDNTKKDPSGPECLWPEYLNCKYSGAQRYLKTGAKPSVVIGAWSDIKIQQNGNTFSVSVQGVNVVTYTDFENPYTIGRLGLYNEDAYVRFDNIQMQSAP